MGEFQPAYVTRFRGSLSAVAAVRRRRKSVERPPGRVGTLIHRWTRVGTLWIGGATFRPVLAERSAVAGGQV